MKILLASSEVHPYSKTGGLADMTSALARALARAGHQVGVVTPLYAEVRGNFPQLTRTDIPLQLQVGSQQIQGEVFTLAPCEGLTIYFIGQPNYFERGGLYQENGADYADNAERFIFLSKAVAHLATALPWKPDVVHLNDWQVALVPLLLKHRQKYGGLQHPPATCLTIHNLAYQGVFPASKYGLTNLPAEYFSPAGVEYYGQMSCLKSGIVFADALTTVSPRYAREILTPEFGCGLDGLLRHRQNMLVGILNGVDYEEWDPEQDPYLRAPYSEARFENKLANKLALQKEFNLPVNATIPLFGNIGRMVHQKGVDLLLSALEMTLASGFQFVLLGTGDANFQSAFQDLGRRYPSQVSVRIGFDQGLSHRIEAGADFFLMPSRFEPCGLNQLYGLRYAAIPIVRAVGGLDDTVQDFTKDPVHGTGFKFEEASPVALAGSIRRALEVFARSEDFLRLRQNAMRADYSWDRMGEEYLAVYQKALKAG